MLGSSALEEGPTDLRLNPNLTLTAAPPIPEAKAWTARYDGSAGPLIDLSQAVPGYPPHRDLLQRLGDAARSHEAAAYGDILGDAPLRSAYAADVSAIYGTRIEAENIAITAGCNQAFFIATIALAKAGDAIMLPTPWYFNHKMALDMLGIEAIALPCRAENGFVPDAYDAGKLVNNRVRAIVLVTPNNPTGAVYPPKTIAAFRDLCAERNVPLVLDETYRDFIKVDAPPHACLAEPDWQKTVIQLYSFSKAYCIPGHRAGAIVADESTLAEVAKIMDTLQICAPRIPQLVLPWAIDALRNWREENRQEIARRAAAFTGAVDALDGWSIGSIGAYFAYVAHPFRDRGDVEICEWLAAERGVLCLPGGYFGPSQEGFLRVAFANVDVSEIEQIPQRLTVNALNQEPKRASARDR
jgi:aspartate/methionine/tyrosine aminotransferase